MTQQEKIIQMYIFNDEYIKTLEKEKGKLLSIAVPYIEIRNGNQVSFKFKDNVNEIMSKLNESIDCRISQIRIFFT